MEKYIEKLTFEALKQLTKNRIKFSSFEIYDPAIKIGFNWKEGDETKEYVLFTPIPLNYEINWENFITAAEATAGELAGQFEVIQLPDLKELNNWIREGIEHNLRAHENLRDKLRLYNLKINKSGMILNMDEESNLKLYKFKSEWPGNWNHLMLCGCDKK